jgi:hypothetical protein
MELSTAHTNAANPFISYQSLPTPNLNRACKPQGTQTTSPFLYSGSLGYSKNTPIAQMSSPLVYKVPNKSSASKTRSVGPKNTALPTTPKNAISSHPSQQVIKNPTTSYQNVPGRSSSLVSVASPSSVSNSEFNGAGSERGKIPTVTAIIVLVSFIWLLWQ